MTGPARGALPGRAVARARRARWRSSDGARRRGRAAPAAAPVPVRPDRAEDRRQAGGGRRRHLARASATPTRRRPRLVVAGDARAGRPPGHPPVPVQPRAGVLPRGRGRLLRDALRRHPRPGHRDHPGAGRQGGRRQRQPGLPRPGRRRPGQRPGLPRLHHRPAAGGRRAGAHAAPAGAGLPARPGRDPGGRRRPRAADVPQLPQQPDRRGDRGRLLRAGGRLRAPPRPDRRARQRLLRDHLRRLPRARRSSRRRAPWTWASRSSRSRRPTT